MSNVIEFPVDRIKSKEEETNQKNNQNITDLIDIICEDFGLSPEDKDDVEAMYLALHKEIYAPMPHEMALPGNMELSEEQTKLIFERYSQSAKRMIGRYSDRMKLLSAALIHYMAMSKSKNGIIDVPET